MKYNLVIVSAQKEFNILKGRQFNEKIRDDNFLQNIIPKLEEFKNQNG